MSSSSTPPPDSDEARAIAQEEVDVEREAPSPAKRSTDTGDGNVRLERLRAALDKFLDLIEYQVSSAKIAKSLPRMDSDVVESLRQQFVHQLKQSIKEENEKLITENELDEKLSSLHALAAEADARYAQGLRTGSEQLKDVWRADLDIETAISARAIPEQEERVAALRDELKQIQKTNAQLHAQLKDVSSRVEERRSEANEALSSLEETIKALEASPDMDNQLRQTMEDLLADLGART